MRKWWKDNWGQTIFWAGLLILVASMIIGGFAGAGRQLEWSKQDWLNCREVQRQSQKDSLWAQDAFKAWDCKEILEKVKVD